MLDNIRKSGKWLNICLLVFFLGAMVFGLAFSGLSILEAASRRDTGSVVGHLFALGAFAGILFLVVWMLRNSKEEQSSLQNVRQAKPDPNGDMSDVAGIPHRDPWMG